MCRTEGDISGDLAASGYVRSPAPKIVVLQRSGPSTTNSAGEISDIFQSLNSWPGRREAPEIILGRSITENMHPLFVAALHEFAHGLSGRAQIAFDCHAATGFSSDIVARLAQWLKAEWSLAAAGPKAGEMSAQELTYFIVSGAQRALALKQVIATAAEREPASILDVGAGIGFISFLAALSGKAPVQHACAVDVARKYKAPAERLWAAAPEIAFAFEPSGAETFQPAHTYDVVLICQCIFRFPASQRAEIFKRLMEALSPGGLLIINEILRSGEGSDEDWNAKYPSCVPQSELLAGLAPLGTPELYLRSSGWKDPVDPSPVSAREWASNSFLVLRRP